MRAFDHPWRAVSAVPLNAPPYISEATPIGNATPEFADGKAEVLDKLSATAPALMVERTNDTDGVIAALDSAIPTLVVPVPEITVLKRIRTDASPASGI
jgi:hypothetical protein